MRKCLVISLFIAVAMCVGCTTQTWKGTQFEPGSGRNTDTPWQVHSGLFEAGVAFKAGLGKVNNETSEEFGGYTVDLSSQNLNVNLHAGYMINDFWEIGGVFEYALETVDLDIRHAPGVDEDLFGDVDVRGWSVGPRLVYNFSLVGTDVVPYMAYQFGYGNVDYELEDYDTDATRMLHHVGLGVRLFPWDGISLNFELYGRSVEDQIEGDVEDVTLRSLEGGFLVGVSVFF